MSSNQKNTSSSENVGNHDSATRTTAEEHNKIIWDSSSHILMGSPSQQSLSSSLSQQEGNSFPKQNETMKISNNEQSELSLKLSPACVSKNFITIMEPIMKGSSSNSCMTLASKEFSKALTSSIASADVYDTKRPEILTDQLPLLSKNENSKDSLEKSKTVSNQTNLSGKCM
jgi:hypothetical protein